MFEVKVVRYVSVRQHSGFTYGNVYLVEEEKLIDGKLYYRFKDIHGYLRATLFKCVEVRLGFCWENPEKDKRLPLLCAKKPFKSDNEISLEFIRTDEIINVVNINEGAFIVVTQNCIYMLLNIYHIW